MKRIFFFLFSFIFISSTWSQEIGYTTTDVGGEFQWHKNGTIYALHLAFNSKLNKAFNIRFGYNKTDRDGELHDNEKGSGWGGTLGYRYYFTPFPHKFFIGIKSDLWRMKVDWTKGVQSGVSKLWVVQPTLELGYLFFINDQAFITPTIANGVAINLATDGEEVGKGFIMLIGLSAGVRF